MPFEKFDKGRQRGRSKSGPRVSLTDARFYFNAEAVELMGNPGFLEYFWDPDASRVGFKPSGEGGYSLCKQKMANAYVSCCVAFKKASGLEGVNRSQMVMGKEGDLFIVNLEREEAK